MLRISLFNRRVSKVKHVALTGRSLPHLLVYSLGVVTLAHVALTWWAAYTLSRPATVVTLPVMVSQLVSQAPITQPEPLPVKPEPPKPVPTPTPAPKPRPAPTPPAPQAPPSERAVSAPPAEPPAPPAPVPASSAPPAPSPALPAPASAPPPAAKEAAEPVVPPRSDAAHLSNPAPVYPAISRRMGEEGRVLFDVYILPNGTVGEIKLKHSSGFARLDDAALEAVRQWRYVPAKRGDQPIPFWYVQPVSFAIR